MLCLYLFVNCGRLTAGNRLPSVCFKLVDPADGAACWLHKWENLAWDAVWALQYCCLHLSPAFCSRLCSEFEREAGRQRLNMFINWCVTFIFSSPRERWHSSSLWCHRWAKWQRTQELHCTERSIYGDVSPKCLVQMRTWCCTRRSLQGSLIQVPSCPQHQTFTVRLKEKWWYSDTYTWIFFGNFSYIRWPFYILRDWPN